MDEKDPKSVLQHEPRHRLHSEVSHCTPPNKNITKSGYGYLAEIMADDIFLMIFLFLLKLPTFSVEQIHHIMSLVINIMYSVFYFFYR